MRERKKMWNFKWLKSIVKVLNCSINLLLLKVHCFISIAKRYLQWGSYTIQLISSASESYRPVCW